jgi:hypothetical protein
VVKTHLNAITELYNTQNIKEPNKSALRNKVVKQYLAVISMQSYEREKKEYRDKGVGSLMDGYSESDIIRIASAFLDDRSMEVGLRDRFDFLLGDAMLHRGDEKRKAELSDFSFVNVSMDSIGPNSAFVLLMGMKNSKMNKVIFAFKILVRILHIIIGQQTRNRRLFSCIESASVSSGRCRSLFHCAF